MNRSIREYIHEYFLDREELPIKVIDRDTGDCNYYDIETGTGLLGNNHVVLYPIGRDDSEGTPLYQADIVIVSIKTKYGITMRGGVIRTEGFWASGIDYFDDYGRLSEEGDFLDEVFIAGIRKIGDLLEVENREGFDWQAYL